MSDQSQIVIADSHEIVRDGIAALLSEKCNVDVVGLASDGYGTIKACRQHSPDILLMDLSLARPSGPETLGKLRQSNPDLKIVVISSEASISDAFFVLSQGAAGFMPKQAKGADFVNAIRAAENGYTYLPITFLKEFVQSRRNVTRTGNIFGLSPREIEVLESCVAGHSTKEVAHELNISVRTVETHRNSIYRKTDCKSYKDLTKIVAAM